MTNEYVISEELERFLNHVDSILELTKPVYEAGERTAVYFTLLNKFNIGETEGESIQNEIIARDLETPSISFYQDKVYTVIISNPWKLNEDGTITRPDKSGEPRECVINTL